MLGRLIVVGVESAELYEEYLTADAESASAPDDAGYGLQRGGEVIVRELVGDGVEILRRFAMPVGPAGSMELASRACAAMERSTTTSYSLAKRLFSSAERIEERALLPAWLPKSGLARPPIGMGPAEVTLSWKELYPERKSATPAVEMQVNAELEFMLAIRSAMAPPQPVWTPLPLLATMPCHAAV